MRALLIAVCALTLSVSAALAGDSWIQRGDGSRIHVKTTNAGSTATVFDTRGRRTGQKRYKGFAGARQHKALVNQLAQRGDKIRWGR